MREFVFNLDDAEPPTRRPYQPQPPWGKLWMVIFSSVFLAMLLSGLIVRYGKIPKFSPDSNTTTPSRPRSE